MILHTCSVEYGEYCSAVKVLTTVKSLTPKYASLHISLHISLEAVDSVE